MIDPENPPSRQVADRAADGRPNPPAADTFDRFVQFQEDGQLNAELTEELRNIASELRNAAIDNGGKAKGKLTVSFDFSLDGAIFAIASKYKVDLPQAKRSKSVMWATEDGRFTPQNPSQMNLFGSVREVRGAGGLRDA